MQSVVAITDYSRTRRATARVNWRSSRPVEEMKRSLSFHLRELRREILEEKKKALPWWLRSDRQFRQKFCKIVREYAGISASEVCETLNAHPEILKLCKLPGASYFYPINPEFLEKLENKIHSVIEYNPYGGGFLGLGMMGVPTSVLAATIAEICGVSSSYRKFEKWCDEYSREITLTTNQNGPL